MCVSRKQKHVHVYTHARAPDAEACPRKGHTVTSGATKHNRAHIPRCHTSRNTHAARKAEVPPW